MIMPQPKKLIEVAMPVKEISAESVRDKSIRHGHISTLHLWWARRPLPVCRAVVFASLVPDPLDENCPQAFRDAVKELLGKPFALRKGDSEVDWYKPYADIPYTAAHDLMDDNLRNRLLMFIGKYSDKFVENERLGKSTQPKEQLNEASLIKWESRNNETIIGIARKLIWVAYNSRPANAEATAGKQKAIGSRQTAFEMLDDFDRHYSAIKNAEHALYSLPDRHVETPESRELTANLENAIGAFLDRMPRVFDPFAGGGAIPLEAARLGCRSYGNDINPVAHIIQKGSVEFPQKYGKPITYSKAEFEKIYGEEAFRNLPGEWKKVVNGETTAVRIPNRLSFDVEYYAKKLLKMAEDEIGHLYPADEKGNKPIAYYWARVGTCSNPSCKAEIPLLKQFYLANTTSKQVYLKPIINGKNIDFVIEQGKYDGPEWNNRTNISCPICGNITDTKTLKKQFVNNDTKERLLAVIHEGQNGKNYRLPIQQEVDILGEIPEVDRLSYSSKMQVGNNRNFNTPGWGIGDYSQMFSPRQLYALQTFISKLGEIKKGLNPQENEYSRAIVTYLGILIDRGTAISTSFGRWDVSRENVQSPFSKQAIPMIFDFPEANLLGSATGSLVNQLDWILRYCESESHVPFASVCNNASSGERGQFSKKSISATITDPPYYDAIAYGDLSDFFYVWLKRTVGDIYPMNFATPQTPKADECTALKHHHGTHENAKQHFENKLLKIFDAIELQTSDIVSIMFAHQSTEAWTTLCNSILGARMNITGSWAIDTEMANRSLGLAGAALASSITVSCRPTQREGSASYRDIKNAIDERVKREVEKLYKLGFRGSDLLTASFGQAVSEFGKYERVEKADGMEVTVPELLEMARGSAFNALVKGFDADEYTRFYIAWAELYGFTESDFDDVNRLVKIGLSIETNTLFQENLLTKNKNKQSLTGYEQRMSKKPGLGVEPSDPTIDQAHRGMHLFKANDRKGLLQHIAKVAASPDNLFWRVLNSLAEVLPQDKEHDDKKIAAELLANKDSLIRESKKVQEPTQTTLGI